MMIYLNSIQKRVFEDHKNRRQKENEKMEIEPKEMDKKEYLTEPKDTGHFGTGILWIETLTFNIYTLYKQVKLLWLVCEMYR